MRTLHATKTPNAAAESQQLILMSLAVSVRKWELRRAKTNVKNVAQVRANVADDWEFARILRQTARYTTIRIIYFWQPAELTAALREQPLRQRWFGESPLPNIVVYASVLGVERVSARFP
jgi:hypothetical protein